MSFALLLENAGVGMPQIANGSHGLRSRMKSERKESYAARFGQCTKLKQRIGQPIFLLRTKRIIMSEAKRNELNTPSGSDHLQNASDKAEAFICEWTCADSLEEMKRDSWSTSDVHSILLDFILSQNK